MAGFRGRLYTLAKLMGDYNAVKKGKVGQRVRRRAAGMKERLLQEAKIMEEAGAFLLDFTNSGPVAGPCVTQAISIPVIGGLGGGSWLDGRIRATFAAIGYMANAIDNDAERYANVARIALDAISAYAEDVKTGRQIQGA